MWQAARRDHQFLVRLEAIRLNRFTLVEERQHHAALLRFNKARADRDYAEAFRDQGLGEPPDDPEGAAARVRASKWAAHLVAALDDWVVCAADPARQHWLLDVARRADPDPWRDRVRDPAAWRDGKALAELARAASLAEHPVPLLLALGERLTASGEDGIGFLRSVREQHPDDFWANFTLALALHGPERRPGGDPAPALAYYQKALEIRPRAVAVLNDLGVVLLDKGWMWDKEREGEAGAVNVFYQVVKIDPHFAPGLNNLGAGLESPRAIGQWRYFFTRTPWGSIPGWPLRISTSAKCWPVRETSTRQLTTTGRPWGSIPISPVPTTSSVSPWSQRAGATRWTTATRRT